MASATASAYSDNNDEVKSRTETTGASAPADPARATISRERTVRTTEAKYGKRGKSDVKKVSLHERHALVKILVVNRVNVFAIYLFVA